MRKNWYLNIILTILVIIVAISAIIITTALDRIRSRNESFILKLGQFENKLNVLSRDISSGTLRISQNANSAKTLESANFANYEFFDQNAKHGNKIITAIQSETKNMNYIVNNESLVGSLWDYTFDSLASRNFKTPEVFEPQLAESWDISEDKLIYTIKLRKGIFWHDFTDPETKKKWEDVEVTAKDFKFYVDVIKNEDVNCAPSRGYLKDLDYIEIISDYEFKVYWKKKYFLSESITLGMQPLPKHFYHYYDGEFDGKKFNNDHIRNRMIIGCGPYKFEKWEKAKRIILTKWDKYYGKKFGVMPPLDSIILEVIKHPHTQLQSLTSKDIDKMGFTPEQWVNNTSAKEFIGAKAFINKYKYTSMSYSYLGYNQKNDLFKNKNVRKALTHLVDRKRILKDVYHNLGKITTGTFFINSAAYDKSIKPYPFSVKKAKELFAKAGWSDSNGDNILDKDGKNFEFTILSVSSSETQKKMLPIMKEDMERAGVIMNIQKVEWSVYIQRLEKKTFDVCCLGWGLSFESDPYQLWHSSGADKDHSSNHISFKNAKADELIEKIRVEFNLEKRIKLYHQFHQLIHEEQPYTFLFSRLALVGMNKKIQNTKIFPQGMPSRIMWNNK